MQIATTIKTSQGSRLFPRPPIVRITATTSEPRALILLIEREATEAEGELRFSVVADRLSHRALVLRATAP